MIIRSKIYPENIYYAMAIYKGVTNNMIFTHLDSSNYYSYLTDAEISLVDNSFDGYVLNNQWVITDFIANNKEVMNLLNTSDNFQLIGKKIAKLFYDDSNLHYIKYKDRLFELKGVNKKAILIEKPWVQCPECAEAFEVPTNRKFITCPKCQITMYNPYFERYDCP